MKNVKIQIPDMQSAHCQLRVSNAVKAIQGVTVNNIQAGIADISFPAELQQQLVSNAIVQAGYTIAGIEAQETDSESSTFTFKTNINCGGCVAKVTPVLNAESGIDSWNVDTTSKDKVLTVQANGISQNEIMDTIKKTGFKIESFHN